MFLGIIGDADGGDIALDAQPFMFISVVGFSHDYVPLEFKVEVFSVCNCVVQRAVFAGLHQNAFAAHIGKQFAFVCIGFDQAKRYRPADGRAKPARCDLSDDYPHWHCAVSRPPEPGCVQQA